MSAVYSNKFTIEHGPDMVRIVFMDERARIADGVPMAISNVAEVVITPANARALRDVLNKVLVPGEG